MIDLNHAGVDDVNLDQMVGAEIAMSQAQLHAFRADHDAPIILMDDRYTVVSRELFKGMFSVTLQIIATPKGNSHPAS